MKQQGRAPARGLTAGWRVAGALLMLAGAAALWGAFSMDWDLSEDWDAGVFVGWFPMSFEFLGFALIVGTAGTAVLLGFLLLIADTALGARLAGGRGRRRHHPKEVEKLWAEILRQDPRTRTDAKRALAELGASAVPKLVEVLARPNRPLDRAFGTSTHSTALRILDLMGHRADAPLRTLLLDEDPALRAAAARTQTALRKLRSERTGQP